MEVNTKKSKISTNNTKNISADISKNDQKLEELISFNVLAVTLLEDSTFSAKIRKNCLSNGGNGQIKQDLAKLRKRIQGVQVSCHLHPALWL